MKSVGKNLEQSVLIESKMKFWWKIRSFFEPSLYLAIAGCAISLGFELVGMGMAALLLVLASAGLTIISREMLERYRKQLSYLNREAPYPSRIK